MNDAVFGKTMENVRKHRNKKDKKLFSIRTTFSYYRFFHRKFLAIEMRKTQILMNKPDIYKEIAKDVETRCDTSNFEIDRPLPKGRNKK